MSRRVSIAGALRQVGIRVDRATAPVKATATKLIAPSVCAAHLFERAQGGKRCRWCGLVPPLARVRGAGAGRSRGCAPEKDVQRDVIKLLVSIGCRYDKTGKDAEIYVFGTKRPRHLAAEAHRTFQTPGTTDVFSFLPRMPRYARPGYIPPPYVFIEVKAEDGRPSEAQQTFQLNCQVRGMFHVMGGVEELKAFLIQHGFLRAGA